MRKNIQAEGTACAKALGGQKSLEHLGKEGKPGAGSSDRSDCEGATVVPLASLGRPVEALTH